MLKIQRQQHFNKKTDAQADVIVKTGLNNVSLL
jgi:hypothetical protein